MSTRAPGSSPQKNATQSAPPPPYSTTSVGPKPVAASPDQSPSPVNTAPNDASNIDVDMQNSDLGSPIALATDLPERSESPPWQLDPTSLISRSMIDGAYPKLLSVLESWKTDPSVAGRVAVFMEYGVDIKALPGNFGQHLVYRKNADTPLHIVFFGEIAPTSYGTALGAKGNHYVGTSGNVGTPSF